MARFGATMSTGPALSPKQKKTFDGADGSKPNNKIEGSEVKAVSQPAKKTKGERANAKAKRKSARADKRIKRSEKRIEKQEKKLPKTKDKIVSERKQNRIDRQKGKIEKNKEKKKDIETKRVKTIIES